MLVLGLVSRVFSLLGAFALPFPPAGSQPNKASQIQRSPAQPAPQKYTDLGSSHLDAQETCGMCNTYAPAVRGAGVLGVGFNPTLHAERPSILQARLC